MSRPCVTSRPRITFRPRITSRITSCITSRITSRITSHLRALSCLAIAALSCLALPAWADATLGRVETLYIAASDDLLIEVRQDRPARGRLVAGVRLRDGAGKPTRRVLVKVGSELVERGDIVAIRLSDDTGGFRTGPLADESRVVGVEARYDSPVAQRFFANDNKVAAATGGN